MMACMDKSRLQNLIFEMDFRALWKGLSDSRSGATNKYLDYNEGLKIGVFSYLISTYKCYGPNETNFMDFGQKLRIF